VRSALNGQPEARRWAWGAWRGSRRSRRREVRPAGWRRPPPPCCLRRLTATPFTESASLGPVERCSTASTVAVCKTVATGWIRPSFSPDGVSAASRPFHDDPKADRGSITKTSGLALIRYASIESARNSWRHDRPILHVPVQRRESLATTRQFVAVRQRFQALDRRISKDRMGYA
jgi:hypothetical protein